MAHTSDSARRAQAAGSATKREAREEFCDLVEKVLAEKHGNVTETCEYFETNGFTIASRLRNAGRTDTAKKFQAQAIREKRQQDKADRDVLSWLTAGGA